MSSESVNAFDVSSDDWFLYIAKVEKYFKDKGIKPDLKLKTLLSLMGDEANRLLLALASPDEPKNMTYEYEDAVMLLNKYFKPSILESRYKFWQRKQTGNETLENYAAELEKLAHNCRFEKSHRMEQLRDQFICGLGGDKVRQKFFVDYYRSPPEFYDAVRIAKAYYKIGYY